MWCSSSKTLKEVRSKERSAVPAIFQLQLWAKETWTGGSYISSECITSRTVCRESFNFTMGRGTRVETGGKKTKQGRMWCTCLHVFPQSEVMYISSLYSTSLEPRLPEGKMEKWKFHQAGSRISDKRTDSKRTKKTGRTGVRRLHSEKQRRSEEWGCPLGSLCCFTFPFTMMGTAKRENAKKQFMTMILFNCLNVTQFNPLLYPNWSYSWFDGIRCQRSAAGHDTWLNTLLFLHCCQEWLLTNKQGEGFNK